MTSPQLRSETCRECGCDVQVAPYSPWEGTDQPTGCAASGWDSEACQEYHVGWICLECACKAAMRTGDEPGIRGMLGGPGPDWDFSYTRGVQEPMNQTERKPWLRSAHSDADGMSLPAGKTCQSCVWLDNCRKLFNVNPLNEVCDWSPCRYRAMGEE